MPSDIKYNSESQIVEIMHSGILTVQNLEKSTAEAMAMHKELGVTAFLIDASNLESVENLMDVYDLPEQYDESGLSRAARIAVVMPETTAAREAVQFYDNVCNNRGWEVRSFEKLGEANEWLTANEFT